ncbi:15278_t:CDS:10 [Acaulospora morrowiae]|uniref:Autophagy-related protein 2 n=1 Tax=Acaulospora morrowiae TaxID=94023 RepID=A0A9N8V2Y1_9GLOM|nr:15278_t:CDS:10 [Acaulospora morrowiae]
MYKGWPFSGWGLSINVPSTIQKRLLKFLLKRALGQFLAEELDLDNLEVQLGKGLVHLKELQLNVEVLNDLVADLPIVITDGRIGRIVANIPWKNIWNCDCVLEFHNLKITAVPEYTKPRNAKVVPEDSHILSSSIHFAGDFLRHEMPPEEDEELRNSIYHSFTVSQSDNDIESGLEHSDTLPQQAPMQGDSGIESIQVLARLIDKLMSNIKIVFKDTCIRLVHHSSVSFNDKNDAGNLKEYYFDLEIPNASFQDETRESDDESTPTSSGTENVKLTPALSETVKSVTISGLSVWIRETLNSTDPTNLLPRTEEYMGISDSEDYTQKNGEHTKNLPRETYEAMILSCVDEENLIRVTLRPNVPSPIQMDLGNFSSSYYYNQEAIQQANITQNWTIEGLIKSVTAALTPNQLALIADLENALSKSKSSSETRLSSSTESDDDYVSESTRANSRISEGLNYRRMSQPSQDDDYYRMDNLVFQNSTSTLHSTNAAYSNKTSSRPYYKSTIPNSTPTANTPTTAAPLGSAPSSTSTINFKLDVSVVELFFLYDDPPPNLMSDRQFFFNKPKDGFNMDHLKIDVNKLMCQIQWWSPDSSPGGQRRSSSSSSGSYLPGYQKSTEADESLRVIMDLTVSDLAILEWLRDPSTDTKSKIGQSRPGYTLPAFNSYTQLLGFDSHLINSYDPDESGPQNFFPIIKNTEKSRASSSRRFGKFGLRRNYSANEAVKDVIRIKLEVGNVANEGLPNVYSDVSMEFEPFYLHLDLRIVDRIERYINIFSIGADGADSFSEENTTKQCYNGQESSQLIIDDLDTQRLHENTALQKFRLRISCEMIRLWLHCPDVSGENTQSTMDKYSIHSSLLIADLIHMNAAIGCISQNEPSRSANFGIQQSETDTNDFDLQKNRIRIECGGINVFVKESNVPDAKCILIAKPLASQSLPHRSMIHSVPIFPNCEITYRPTSSITNRISYAGGGARPSPFSRTFSTFEGEERANWPAENEEEEVLMFKQRTIESSMFVIHCNFPLVRIRMTKSSYDTLQILLNDLSVWQPKSSSITSENFGSRPPPPVNHANFVGGYTNKSHDTFSGSNLYDSELLNSRVLPLRPSLASIIIAMTSVEFVMLHEDKGNSQKQHARSYQLNMLDLRFFAVIKHEGIDDTYIILDNDQFNFLETSGREKSQILCRTLSKNIKAKNNRPMISVIMHISLDTDLNMKETNLALSVNGVSLKYSQDPQWIDDVLGFLQEPEMKSYVDLPAQFTKLFVTINDSSIDYKSDGFNGRIVAVFDSLKASSNIIPDSPMFAAKLIVRNLDLMLIDDIKTLNDRIVNRSNSTPLSVKKYWKLVGLVKAASLDFAEINLRANKGEIYPHLELELTDEKLTIETCADTFQTIIGLINQMVPKSENIDSGTGKRIPHITTTGKNFVGNDLEESIYPDMLEEFFSLENGKNATHDSDNYIFEHAVIDDFNDEDFMVEQQLFAVPAPSATQKNLKTLDVISRDDTIRVLDSEPLNFVDDHFSVPTISELKEAHKESVKSLTRIRLRDFNIVWKLYDGYDWERTRNEVKSSLVHSKSQTSVNSTGTVNEANSSSDTEAVSPFDRLLFTGSPFRNPDYDGSSQPASESDYLNDDQSETASQVSSRVDSESTSVRDGKRPEQSHRDYPKLRRSRSSKLEIQLNKVNMEFDMFPKDNLIAFRLLLLVRDLEILDNIKTSAWRKFLTHMRPDNDTSPRESKSNMLKVDLQSVRPLPSDPVEELRLKAKFLPLRFYIDQDALNFIIRFFAYQDSNINSPSAEDDTYFQHFEIQPISMKLDYKPKHIDYTNLKEGNFVELMNLFHLEAAEMTLRGVKLTGVKGIPRLLEDLGAAWLPHIKSTQMPNVVSGVTPIRSLVNIGSGVADLILLPIEQYKKDGRIIRGLQRGTQSFAKATTMEAIKFGTKLAVGTQTLLEHAEEILSTNDDNGNLSAANNDEEFDSEEDDDKELISKYADQPADLNEGIEAAYKSLRQNFGTAAHTIFAVPMKVYEKTGTQGSVKAVIRAVPVAVLKPMIGASEAVSKGLMGLRNTIDPNKKLQMEDR